MTAVDAALIYEPRKGWYLAPSPALEYRCTPKQAPPPLSSEVSMSTTTAERTGRCTWAGCREVATTSTPQGWDFCDEHGVKDAELKNEQDRVVHRPATQPLPRPAAPLAVVPTASPIGKLLEDASAHSVQRVRTLGARIERHLDELRGLIREHEAAEAARQAERVAKEKARAEVTRLEQELAAAKAKLRGKPTESPTRGGGTHGEFPCRKGCSKVISTAAARGNHEKHCTGGAA